ncbi:MAG: hypothetical protein AAF368_20080, partial [Planctomycetota bacterium]
LAPSNRPLTDVGVGALVGLRALRHLALLRGIVLDSPDALGGVLALPNLERLALGSLKCRHLGVDDILAESFRGARTARSHPPPLRRLKFLKLIHGAALGPRALQAIVAKAPALERFELSCDPVKYDDLAHLFQHFHQFPALRTIVLLSMWNDSGKFTNHDVDRLRALLAPIDFRTGAASWSPSNHLPDLFRY